MKRITWTWLPMAVLALGSFAAAAQGQKQEEMRIHKALMSPERPQSDKSRDEGRKPMQVVQFLGIKTGDKVVDVIAAGGYYDWVLSAAVGPSGKVYSQNPSFLTSRPGFTEQENKRNEMLGNVEPIHGDLPDGIKDQADAAITALNFHDIYNRGGEAAGVMFLKGIYDSLKPGGTLGVIDHIGEAGNDNAKLHRVPPEAVKSALMKAGFKIEAESDLLHNPKDTHKLPSHDPSLRWHTDRLLIRARKPG